MLKLFVALINATPIVMLATMLYMSLKAYVAANKLCKSAKSMFSFFVSER